MNLLKVDNLPTQNTKIQKEMMIELPIQVQKEEEEEKLEEKKPKEKKPKEDIENKFLLFATISYAHNFS